MIHKIITPSFKLDLAKKTRERLSWHNLVFIISILGLPILIYLLFQLNLVKSAPEFSNEIEAAVALVATGETSGTAFLVNSTTLLTARHVVNGKKVGDLIDLYFKKSSSQLHISATIKYISKTDVVIQGGVVPISYFLTDFAVLSVPEIVDILPLNITSSSDVRNLDEVILVGYPNGDYSITKGNINSDTFQGINLFKIDAAANPGNSGGPCLSKSENAVIGILVGGSGIFYQGENIALKIDDVVRELSIAGIKL